MKVALVHDDLIQWGGAERVLLALTELFPQAPIFTSLLDKENPMIKQSFHKKTIYTSFLQEIPYVKSLYKSLLPLYPLAFEQFNFSSFDLVISQTTRFAKSILTKPQTMHICYCHTPPRFLWNLSNEKSLTYLQPYFSMLRIYDQISQTRVDHFLAGSFNCQERIRKIYKRDSSVVQPFVDLNRFKSVDSFSGGYFLVISRLNRYKRVDLAIKVANKLGINLKIIGIGPAEGELKKIAGPTVEFLGALSDDLVVENIAGCEGLIISAEEDFGLTSLEAQALGKPVIAYGAGGALETVIDGVTGYLFPLQSEEDLTISLKKLIKFGYNNKQCLKQAERFSKENFLLNFNKNILQFSKKV